MMPCHWYGLYAIWPMLVLTRAVRRCLHRAFFGHRDDERIGKGLTCDSGSASRPLGV